MTSSEATDTYYDVVTPSGDDIAYISHHDIITNKCRIEAKLLNDKDVTEIKALLKEKEMHRNVSSTRNKPSVSYQGMDTAVTESSSDEPSSLKKSFRPGRMPSRSWIKAQKFILGTKAKSEHSNQPIVQGTSDALLDPSSSSYDIDETIIYYENNKQGVN